MSIDNFSDLKQQELLERMTARSVESTDRRRRPKFDSIDDSVEHRVRLKPELSFRDAKDALEGTHRTAMSVHKHLPRLTSSIRKEDQLLMTGDKDQTQRALMAHNSIMIEMQRDNDSLNHGDNIAAAMNIAEQYQNAGSDQEQDVSALHKLTRQQEQLNTTGHHSLQSSLRDSLKLYQSVGGRASIGTILERALQTDSNGMNSARKRQDSAAARPINERQTAELSFIQGFVGANQTFQGTGKKERLRDAGGQPINYAKSRDMNRHFLKQTKNNMLTDANLAASRLAASASPMRATYQTVGENGGDSPTKEDAVADRLICLIKTNEPHIRRAVERRSQYWVENRLKNQGANIYDVKFEFQDQPADYSNLNLRPCQMFNHFQHNTEVTTKSGLARSLYANTHPQMNVDKWFPRCYDLSLSGQTDELLDDYLKTTAQIIIKKHNALFKQYCGDQMKRALAKVEELRSLRDKGIAAYNYREQKADIMWHFVQSSPCPQNVLVNTKMLERALKYIKQLIANETAAPNDLVKDELRPHDTKGLNGWHGQGPLSKMYSEKTWQQLMTYSKMDLPVVDFAKLPPELAPNKKDLKSLQQFIGNLERGNGQNDSKQDRALAYQAALAGWERPTLYLIYKIHKYHQLLKKSMPQYTMDGMNNVWIVKPCYNARGFGIYCIDNCFQEFQNFMVQTQTKSRIVQKYIEKPLLLQHFNESRKFDIRQWVLVTSFDPLKIYMFSEFYLRICGSKYDLNDISDSYKHLTNFSIQKHNSKVGNKETDLVMSQAEFFRKVFKNDHKKINQVRSGIQQIIVKTIRSGQEAGIEHKPNCFEIYGFDFMLDRKLNPWLLEVNLSPACAERTEWLVDMLDRMTDGLFDMIEQRMPRITDDFKGDLKSYLQKRRKQNIDTRTDGWLLIYDQQKQSTNWQRHEAYLQKIQDKPPAVQNNNALDIYGHKINTRGERKVQQLHLQRLAAEIIQKRWRGYLGRKTLMNLKFELIIVYLQSYIRMYLAKLKKQRLAQEKYSVVVQKFLRKYLARNIYFRLLAEAYDAMKVRKVCQIQRLARVFISKVRVERQRREVKATIIQKRVRGIQTRRQVAQYKQFIAKVKLIQLFMRHRFYQKQRSAETVQKFIRGFKKFNKYRRLSKVKRATTSIQNMEKQHALYHSIIKWRTYKTQQSSAMKIQRAARAFLKRRRKTVNRTRCMQFYWRKFCRLIKYYRCWEACKLIKDRFKQCVNLIQSQYNVHRLRRLIAARIKHSKVKLVQRMLRKMMQKKRRQHYLDNIDKVIYIQSCFRMVNAKQLALKLLRLKMDKYQEARKFQQKYQQLYREKPAKRKKKLDRLLQEQRCQVLMKERIFIGEAVPQNQLDDNDAYLAGGNGKGRHRPAAGGLFQYKRDTNANKKNGSNLGMMNVHDSRREQRDKAAQAIRYINKHKHLYASTGGQSQDELRKVKQQQESLPAPTKFVRNINYQRDRTPNTVDQGRSTGHKTPVRDKKFKNKGSATRGVYQNKDLGGIVKMHQLENKVRGSAAGKPKQFAPLVDKTARKSSVFLLQQIEHHDRILQQIRDVQERHRNETANIAIKQAQTTTGRGSLPFSTVVRRSQRPAMTTKRDELDQIVEQKLFESITSDQDKTRDEQRKLLLHKTYGERQSIRDDDKRTEKSHRTSARDEGARTIEHASMKTPAGMYRPDDRRIRGAHEVEHRVMLQTCADKQRRFSPMRRKKNAKMTADRSSKSSNSSTGRKPSHEGDNMSSPYAPQDLLELKRHVQGQPKLANRIRIVPPATGMLQHKAKQYEKLGALTPLEGVERARALRESHEQAAYASRSSIDGRERGAAATRNDTINESQGNDTTDAHKGGKNGMWLPLQGLGSRQASMEPTPVDNQNDRDGDVSAMRRNTDGTNHKGPRHVKQKSRKRVRPIGAPTDRPNASSKGFQQAGPGVDVMPYLVEGGLTGQLILQHITSKPSTDQLKRASRTKLPRTGSERAENLPLLKVGAGIQNKKGTVAVLDNGTTDSLFNKSIKAYQDQTDKTQAKLNKMKLTAAAADEQARQSIAMTYKVSQKVAQHQQRQSEASRKGSRRRGGKKRTNDEHSVSVHEHQDSIAMTVAGARQGSEMQLYAVDLGDTSPSLGASLREAQKRAPPLPGQRASLQGAAANRFLKGSAASLEANQEDLRAHGVKKFADRPPQFSNNETFMAPAIGKPKTSPINNEVLNGSVFQDARKRAYKGFMPTPSPDRYGVVPKKHEKQITGGVFDLSLEESFVYDDEANLEVTRDLNVSRNTDDSAILFVSDPTAQKDRQHDNSKRYENNLVASEQKERHAAFLHQVSKKTARKIVEGYSKRLDGLTGKDEFDQRQLGLAPEHRLNQSNKHRFVKQQDPESSPDSIPHLPSPGLRQPVNGYADFINSNVIGPEQPLDFSNVQIPKYFQARLQGNPYDRSGTGELTSAQANISQRQTRATAATYGMSTSLPRKPGPPSASSHFSSVFQKQQKQVAALNSTYNIRARKNGVVDSKQMDLIRKYGGNTLTSGMPPTSEMGMQASTPLVDNRAAVFTPSQRGPNAFGDRRRQPTKNSFLNGLHIGV